MKSTNLNNGFLLLYDWIPAIQSLPGEDAKSFLLALVDRQRNGTALPVFDNQLCNVFAQMIEPVIKRRLDGQAGGIKANEGSAIDTTRGTAIDATPPREDKIRKDKIRKDISPHTPRGAEVWFDRFWKEYPRKVGKQQALKAFLQTKPTEELLQTMLSAIKEQKRSDQWTKENGKYIPYPATWLNRGQWTDELNTNNRSTEDFFESI